MKIKYNWIFGALLVLFVGFSFSAWAQPSFPENGDLYNDQEVPRIDITINPAFLDEMYDDPYSSEEHLSFFKFTSSDTEKEIDSVGLRFRGNTSLNSDKKSFKISLNTFIEGQKYKGVEKLNVNGEHNDPSISRSKLGWDVMRFLEIPASRANHVQLYINDDYFGLYINTEHVDEEFVESRFGNNDGNLYKCLWPADLVYYGSSQSTYKDLGYTLQINQEEDDYSDLVNFIDVLNNTPTAQLPCELEQVFNVEDYLKVIAAEIFLGHWDGYAYNKNNYYLYHNTETGKFEFIPYDIDNTYGIDWMDRNWATRDIYDWANHGEERPLYTKLMAIEKYRDQFSYYMNRLTEEFTGADDYEDKILDLREMIAPFVVNDPLHGADYGWSYQDFYDSFVQASGAHVDYGLIPYAETRNSSTRSQLENNEIAPIVQYINHNQPAINTPFTVSAQISANSEVVVNMIYDFEGSGSFETEMFDDGEHGDGEAGDGLYGGIGESFSTSGEITFQVSAESANGSVNLQPCNVMSVTVGSYDGPRLYINELMASNASTIADEYGEYDDWVEIYNAEDYDVDLLGYALSDNFDNLDKFLFPDISIAAKGFLLVWLDNDAEQGDLHADFKLSKDGEDMVISYEESSDFLVVDGYQFGPQTTDISYGYYPDGGPALQFFETPTPDASNGANGIDVLAETRINPFPNPINSGNTLYFGEQVSGMIYGLSGDLKYRIEYQEFVELNLPSGVYLFKADKSQLVSKIIVL